MQKKDNFFIVTLVRMPSALKSVVKKRYIMNAAEIVVWGGSRKKETPQELSMRGSD